MQEYQLRVVAEKQELDERLKRLEAFSNTEQFANLPKAEQERLIKQSYFMAGYSETLGERIAAFQ